MKRALLIGLFLVAIAGQSLVTSPVSASVPGPPNCYNYFTNTMYYATKWLDSPGTLNGTSGNDILVGSTGVDVINGKGGDDIICSAPFSSGELAAQDTIFGGAGSDYIYGSGSIDGGSGNDSILASGILTVAKGGSGNDTLRADNGATVDGGSGNDLVYSDSGGSTALYGGSGADRVSKNVSAGKLD